MWKERRKKKEIKKERRIMPSLVATTSALAQKPCVRTHYVRTNMVISLRSHNTLDADRRIDITKNL